MKTNFTSIRTLSSAIALLNAPFAFTFVARADAPPVPLIQQAFSGVPASWFQSGRPKDYSPITLDAARTYGNPNAIEVTFSAPVAPATATNAAHYTITPSIAFTVANTSHLGPGAQLPSSSKAPRCKPSR